MDQDIKTAQTKTKLALEALEDRKGEDISIIDINGISTLADYFLIASASNHNQMQALKDNVEEKLGRAGYNAAHIEGNLHGSWILMDYGDIVIHIFDKENRLFYDLERIWRDGKQISPEDVKSF